MPVTPANVSITPPAPGIVAKDPIAHNLDANVYAAQAPRPEGRSNSPGEQVTPPAPPPAAARDIQDQREHDQEAAGNAQGDKRKSGKLDD